MASCRFSERLRYRSAIPGGAIYEDELVHASHWKGDQDEYLGSLIIQTNPHAAGVADLTEDGARDVGPQSTRLARASKAVVGAENVYGYVFAEVVPHFHCLVVARYPGVPEKHWRLNLDDWLEAPRGDVEAVASLAGRLRQALESPSPRVCGGSGEPAYPLSGATHPGARWRPPGQSCIETQRLRTEAGRLCGRA